MRTDVKIDDVDVKCPNVPRAGFSKRIASVGDFIVYNESSDNGHIVSRIARVVGRVTVPKSEANEPEVKGWVVAMVLSSDCTHCSEEWVNPAAITQVRSVPRKLFEFFIRHTLPSVNTLRHALDDGYVCEHYLATAGLDVTTETTEATE